VLPVRRIPTGPWDPCFGIEIDEDGKEHIGIVSNSSTLIGGAPGAGKSTLALQLCGAIVDSTGREVLYIATEEATSPIRARALRLGIRHVDRIRMIPIGVDADLGAIMRNRKPAAFVIDSLSNAFPDTRDQVEFCKAIKKYCVELDSPALIIDHVNKDVDFAGLMDLQHEVDTTLLFTVYEDEDELRELKTVKTRNGPCAKRFFNMTAKGLVYTDPDEEVEDEDL
jgi:DNA repair protein RadA/Sms